MSDTATPTDTDTQSGRPPTAAVIALLPVALAAVVAIVLLAFGLPAVKGTPHDVPIGVAGPPAAATQVSSALAERAPGGFEVTSYPDEDALTEAIRDREAYGGLVMAPSGATILTASAASPVVAQTLTGIGTGMAPASGTAPSVRDVVPLTADDPRGAGLSASLFPLVIGAIAPAFALTRLAGHRRGVLLAAGTVYAVVAGLAFAAVVHFWFRSMEGSYLAEAGVFAATIGASLLAMLGLHRILGTAGLGLGAAALALLANPLSGAATAPEFLASPWMQIGQAMPPGAGSQVLRSVAFFDGAGASQGWIVLGAWALAGLALLAIPRKSPVSD